MTPTEKDLLKMIEAIQEAQDFMYSPGNTDLQRNLRNTREFLEQLLTEGEGK